MQHSIFLFLAVCFFTFSASAQRIEADFFAVNVDTDFGFALLDGTQARPQFERRRCEQARCQGRLQLER